MALIKLNNKAVSNATSFGSISSLGSMTFIKKLTASSSTTLSFVDGSDGVVLDDTYKEYYFTFNNIHAATKGADLQFNFTIDGSNYNIAKTTTMIRTFHGEDGSSAGSVYYPFHLANGTGFQTLFGDINNGNDDSGSGYMQLFNPSSTTFVKHYLSHLQISHETPRSMNFLSAGYGNTTSAVTGVQFKLDSGNIDAGDICLYGIA